MTKEPLTVAVSSYWLTFRSHVGNVGQHATCGSRATVSKEQYFRLNGAKHQSRNIHIKLNLQNLEGEFESVTLTNNSLFRNLSVFTTGVMNFTNTVHDNLGNHFHYFLQGPMKIRSITNGQPIEYHIEAEGLARLSPLLDFHVWLMLRRVFLSGTRRLYS